MADAVQTVMGSPVGADEPLMAAGLDSLGATELQQNLADSLSMELPSTLVFDYPNINAIVEFLAGKLTGASAGQQLAEVPRALAGLGGVSSRAVAIAGAAGHTSVLQRYTGGDASSRVPLGRWDVDLDLITKDGTLAAQVRGFCGNYMTASWNGAACFCNAQLRSLILLALPHFHGIHPTQPLGMKIKSLAPCLLQFGVFLESVDKFDLEAFGIMRSEAVTMDPQQRLLLHAVHGALTDGTRAVSGRNVGAYVGIAATDYDPLSRHWGVAISSFSFTAASPSVAAGRISYVFGLRGQNASVDTACSASLVATHLACAAFR